MRASQRVLVEFLKALANGRAGHELEVGLVFRLDRSLRSAEASGAANGVKTSAWARETGGRLSKNVSHSRQAGRRKNSSVSQRQPSKQLKRVQELQHSTVTSFVSIKIDTRARAGREGLD